MPEFWTRKNPLNIFRVHKLTFARNRNSCGAGGGDRVSFGIFPLIFKAWSGLTLSLT
jgi:hypothetical protein